MLQKNNFFLSKLKLKLKLPEFFFKNSSFLLFLCLDFRASAKLVCRMNGTNQLFIKQEENYYYCLSFKSFPISDQQHTL